MKLYYATTVTQHRTQHNLKETAMETQPIMTPKFMRLIAEIRTITGIDDVHVAAIEELLKEAYDAGEDAGYDNGFNAGYDAGYYVGRME